MWSEMKRARFRNLFTLRNRTDVAAARATSSQLSSDGAALPQAFDLHVRQTEQLVQQLVGVGAQP